MTDEFMPLLRAAQARRRRADWLVKRGLAMLSQSVSGKRRTALSKATVAGVASGIRERRPLAALRWARMYTTDAQRVPAVLSLLATATSLIESTKGPLALVRRFVGGADTRTSATRSAAATVTRIEAATATRSEATSVTRSEDVALKASVIYLSWVGPVIDRCLDQVVDQLLDAPRTAREKDSYNAVTVRKKAIADVASCFLELAQPQRLSRAARGPRVLADVQAARMIASSILETANLEIDADLRCAPFAPQNQRRALLFTLKKPGAEQAVRRSSTLVVEVLSELDTALYATLPKIWALAKHAAQSSHAAQ